ncbi:hypothetical protein M758_4G006400 [Ceratodon purpureus]|nr:hypothetical protein M758_4G006400 [Ceratodon purpureus]
MSRHSRLPITGSEALDERERHPLSNPAKTTYKLAGGHRDEIYSNGHGKRPNDAPKHRRVISASVVRLRDGPMLANQSHDESMPELFLGAPLEDMDEAERRTLQTQWADALKKVQSLRQSGAGSRSERWSGVATDIYRPKSQATQDSLHASGARTSRVPAASLDHWSYYPGPSVNRDLSKSQLDKTIPENIQADSGTWDSSFLNGALSSRGSKSFGGDLLKGRGSRSITTFEKLDPSIEATQSISGDNMVMAQQGRASTDHRVVIGRAQVVDQASSNGQTLDQFEELPPPKSYSAVASRVQRTQSERYGRLWGQIKPEATHVQEMSDRNSGAPGNAALPSPVLKKAISMREGGTHADAVMEMARAYTDTVCGVPKTLECASCGRSLGVIVQGNPGVDIAFCQACRPSPLQWKKSGSEDGAGSKKKKNGIIRFCRKILRLDKKSS